MDLIEILNNIFGFSTKPEIHYNLSNETLIDLMQISEYHKIGNHIIYLHGLFPPYDDFLFNPYFQMIMMCLGAFAINDMFDILIWPYIRPYRNKVKQWILKKLKFQN